jgi:hypothetical protein
MKQLLKFGLIFTIATSGLLFTACQGEDGDPGAVGPQGDKGDKGDTGEEGVGFDEATQYGNITVQFKGTRIDNKAFDQTVNFKFSPIGPDAANASGVWDYNNEDGSGTEFNLSRYNSAIVSYSEGSSNSYFQLNYIKLDEGDSYVRLGTNVAIVSDDMKFFSLYRYLYASSFSAEETVTEYDFNSATGTLKFKFKAVIPANGDYNNTGHELEISADVNVIVLQSIQIPD